LFLLAIFWLGGCTVGPNYVRPKAEVPADYKESNDWKVAQPSAEAIKGKWWEVYKDPLLNTLEEKIDVSNQSLKAAQAQFLQARAAVRISRSFLFPTVTANPAIARERFSQNRPLGVVGNTQTFNDFQVPGIDASYELDVWGRVRRTVEQSRSQAQASAADLASVGLSLHAELAMDYFQLRGLDTQKQLLDSTVVAYQKALDLTQTRFKGGLASDVDVAQAQTQLGNRPRTIHRCRSPARGVRTCHRRAHGSASVNFYLGAFAYGRSAAADSSGFAVRLAREATRCFRSGKTNAGGERANWYRQSCVLPADHTHGTRRL
jgi:hypothetical protein